ncbi:MAG: AAA family ATPase [Endomicrobium sp.]|nr:AAA family ATPase [Endomicrobium sp.]
MIHLDFTELAYDTPGKLEGSLFDFVKTSTRQNNIELQNSQLETMFAELTEKMLKKAGDRVVIWGDEYDKPITDNLNNKEALPATKKEHYTTFPK